jgi:predicted sugar kinase
MSWVAAQVHQPAHGEGNDTWRPELAIRPGAAKAANRCQYQRTIKLLQIGVAEPQLVEISVRLVFDHHIGMGSELTKLFVAVGLFEI